MATTNIIYRHSLMLLTDLYQLTMAQGYWHARMHQQEAVFHLFFRRLPFRGRFALFCGLDYAIDFLNGFGFDGSDLEYLAGLENGDGSAVFQRGFLDYLRDLKLSCDVYAMPEGTAVFPNQPMLRVRGPILQCQLLETALLNIVNFQTLIATKAARITAAAGEDPVLEFGLRRAQGIDGALAASRAAFIGGCAATSNVLAGKLFDIPVRGTHAHSWVMSFEDELASFQAYAEAMPANCTFLVDTYDTLEGVRKAIQVGEKLREKGHSLLGIRLDSGDLADLSIRARRLLDAAGFEETVIVASNDLDEHAIAELKRRGARIGMWGVGTKLATAHDQPALGGVYKLGALRDGEKGWKHKIKLSEEAPKTSIPGILQVRRFRNGDKPVCDVIFDELSGPPRDNSLIDIREGKVRHPDAADQQEDLLKPLFLRGKPVVQRENARQARLRARFEIESFQGHGGEEKPAPDYVVGLEPGLAQLRSELIRASGKAAPFPSEQKD